MSKIIEDATADQTKLAHSGFENESDFTDDFHDFTFEKETEKIVEQCPFGHFVRFNDELGNGAYKTVYRAYDNDSGNEVAWNVIRLQRLPLSRIPCFYSKLISNSLIEERKRILDEVHLLKSLKHPNVIHFISAWINKRKEEVVFITEIVTGGSLKSYLKKIKNPKLKVIKNWCRGILQGLDYLHSMKPNPVIHRDLKCENIFINSNNGEIRIGDLGLATCMSGSFAKSVLGTPHFMAPEMYEEVYGTGVDIYSFGMCLLEMVTQQVPYSECSNAAQIYKKVLTGKKPQSLDLILNEELKSFILNCLKEKDERPSAKELLQSKFLTQDNECDNTYAKILIEANDTFGKEDDTYLDATKDDSISLDIDLLALNCNLRKVETENAWRSVLKHKLSPAKSDKLSLSKRKEDPKATTKEAMKESALSKHEEEESSKFTYEFNITSKVKSQIYVDVKIESQELQYFKQKIIQVDQNKFTVETLLVEIKRAFELQIISAVLYDSITKFVESVRIAESDNSSKGQNYCDATTSTSSSTVLPTNIITFQDIPNNLSIEKGMPVTPRLENNTPYFQASTFMSCYNQYLNLIPKEYASLETEELMNLRHTAELNELQSAHIAQKKLFLEQKSASMKSLRLPSLCDFNPSEIEETPKGQTPVGAELLPFSPINSGFNFSNAAVFNEENFTSLNNSYEIMSLVKKLSRYSACDELNKSNLISNAVESVHVQRTPKTPANAASEKGGHSFGNCVNSNARQDSSVSPMNRQSNQNQINLTQEKVVASTVQESEPMKPIHEIPSQNSLKKYQAMSTGSINQKEVIRRGYRGYSMYQIPRQKALKQKVNSPASKSMIWIDRDQNKFSNYQKEVTTHQAKKGTVSPINAVRPQQHISFGASGSIADKLELSVINSLSVQEEHSQDSELKNKISLLTNKNDNDIKETNQSPLISQANATPVNKTPDENSVIQENSRIDESKRSIDLFDIQFAPKSTFYIVKGRFSSSIKEKIKQYVIQDDLRRENVSINEEDVKIVQVCLSVITDTMLEANGHFGHYTEKAVKNYQEKLGIVADGIITKELWNLMKEAFEKKLMTPWEAKKHELRELSNKALEDKKLFKEKQTKDAQRSLKKIQAELIDLSTL